MEQIMSVGVGASSVNIYKNKIDIYLRRAGYIYKDRLDSQ